MEPTKNIPSSLKLAKIQLGPAKNVRVRCDVLLAGLDLGFLRYRVVPPNSLQKRMVPTKSIFWRDPV